MTRKRGEVWHITMNDWKPWFAWRPVRTNTGLVWWRQVERRFGSTGVDCRWEYRTGAK